jgi:hypothetical protein
MLLNYLGAFCAHLRLRRLHALHIVAVRRGKRKPTLVPLGGCSLVLPQLVDVVHLLDHVVVVLVALPHHCVVALGPFLV